MHRALSDVAQSVGSDSSAEHASQLDHPPSGISHPWLFPHTDRSWRRHGLPSGVFDEAQIVALVPGHSGSVGLRTMPC
eukprot:6340129-Amphidinium_carterae.2